MSNYDANILVPTGTPQCSPNPTVSFYVGGTNNPHTLTSTQPAYNKWKIQIIDLSSFMGDSIKIDFITADCTAGAHFGYAYLDAMCSPTKIYVNGSINFASTATVCDSAVLSGPPNLNYLWNGPITSSITNVTTQSVVTNVSGIYTLNLMSGTVTLNVQTISLTVNNSSPIFVTASNYSICAGQVTTLTVNGNGPFSCLWSDNQISKIYMFIQLQQPVYR
ncbi:MAG: hypothetical protein IPG08_15615 [Sphingobacteriaceae bacterium]|nr:hypothetical protein [Sphingobacteriaceae bacterium]